MWQINGLGWGVPNRMGSRSCIDPKERSEDLAMTQPRRRSLVLSSATVVVGFENPIIVWYIAVILM